MREKNRQQEAERVTTRNKLIKWLTGAGVLLVLCFLPIVYDDFYFNMLQTKYKFYYFSMIFVSVSLLTILLYYSDTGKTREKVNKAWRGNLSLTDWAMIVFLIIAAVSTLLSEYKLEALWGNEGRYSGLFLILIYGMTYFVITKFFRMKKWYLDAFLLVAIFVCLFGITDYFQMDLLGFKKNVAVEQLDMFTSTLGNINTYTAYVGMVLGVAIALFATSDGRLKTCFYYVAMIIGSFAIVLGTSDNAYLALGAIFAFLPCFLFQSRRGMKRYVIVLASFITVVQCVDWINLGMKDRVLGINGIFNLISQYQHLAYVVAALWGIVVGLYIWDYVKRPKEDFVGNWFRYAWCGLLLLLFCLVIWLIYDANIGGNAERYAGLSNYLVFDDMWGNNRGVAWRLGMEEYLKFPFIQKLVGYGPDTFGILMVENRKKEMTSIAAQIYDSAHNEYLQYLVTVGILGLLSYLTFVGSALVRVIKKVKKSSYLTAIVLAMICYLAQAVVNISLPITTPIFIMFLSMGMAENE